MSKHFSEVESSVSLLYNYPVLQSLSIFIVLAIQSAKDLSIHTDIDQWCSHHLAFYSQGHI